MEITQTLVLYIWQLISQGIAKAIPLLIIVVACSTVIGIMAYQAFGLLTRMMLDAVIATPWFKRRQVQHLRLLLHRDKGRLNKAQRLNLLVRIEALEEQLEELQNPGLPV